MRRRALIQIAFSADPHCGQLPAMSVATPHSGQRCVAAWSCVPCSGHVPGEPVRKCPSGHKYAVVAEPFAIERLLCAGCVSIMAVSSLPSYSGRSSAAVAAVRHRTEEPSSRQLQHHLLHPLACSTVNSLELRRSSPRLGPSRHGIPAAPLPRSTTSRASCIAHTTGGIHRGQNSTAMPGERTPAANTRHGICWWWLRDARPGEVGWRH